MKWEEVKLDECLELITYGFTNPMPDSDNGPWKVTAKDICNGKIDFTTARHTTFDAYHNDLTDKSRPVKDDILLTKDGTLGRLAIVEDEQICINQSVALLRVNKERLLPLYLKYLLETPEYQGKMIADAGGATIKHIYITRVNQLMIPLPPVSVQYKLSNVIKNYDDLIENNQKQIKLLEEAAQRLYKEWFVDLRFPGYEDVEIVDGLPSGWEWKVLGEVTGINEESVSKNYSNSFIDYVDLSSVRNGNIENKTKYLVDDAPGRAKRVARDGDVIWGMVRPNLRSYALVINPKDTDIFSTGFAIITAKEIPFTFLYCMTTRDEFVGYLVNCTNGAAYPAVKPIHFEEAKFVLPDAVTLNKFHKIAEPIFRSCASLKNSIVTLKEARDRLLPKLMSGEVEV